MADPKETGPMRPEFMERVRKDHAQQKPPTEPTEPPMPEQTSSKKRKPKKKRSRGAAVVNVAVTPETADHLRRCTLAWGLHLGRQASQGDTVAAALEQLEKHLRADLKIKVPPAQD